MEKQISYKDVFLTPKKCIVDSRKECCTKVSLGNREFEMPVCASNMKSVVDIDTCKFFARKNWFYIMHRFGVNVLDFIIEMNKEKLFTSISVGINEDSYKILESIYQELLSIDYITIDVANAWSEKTHKMINFIKEKFPETFLIVGNVATGEAVKELEEWGADCIKVGIAGGCFIAGTKIKTKKGLKNIENIKPGELVLTHMNRYKKVLRTSQRVEEKKLYIINNKITCTGNHEFYVIHTKYASTIKDYYNKYKDNYENMLDYATWLSAEKLYELDLNGVYSMVEISKIYKLIDIKNIKKNICKSEYIVYDLEIEEDHSYTVEGIIVHNSVCITKNKTGVSRPMISTLHDCCRDAIVPIIADGGIVEHGDIAKAIACGSTIVLAGSLFAGYDQSAGNIIEIEDTMYKEYYGSASKYNKNELKNIEGKKILIKYRGDMKKLLIELKEDLQSSISYVGGKNLNDLHSAECYLV